MTRLTRLHHYFIVFALLLAGCASPSGQHELRTMPADEFTDLKKSLLFGPDDVRYLRMSRDVLEPNVEELLDVWYSFVGSNPHLVYYFSHPRTKQPDTDYL